MTQIIKSNIDQEVKSRFINYASYVIVDRALPDLRDGFKPVQRRIAYAMHELGLTHRKPYKKSARSVGDTMGKYHPHGDTSIYEAMVVLSQDWKTRYPLIDMHGNNGSIDGDPPAAMRYTESRMSRNLETMLNGINTDVVDFVPNFDDSSLEPSVLPTLVPNILLNGTTGIAVAMATSIPPHHAGSVYEALKYAINQAMEGQDSDIEEMIRIIGTPDFPTGGIITNVEDIKKGYRTGRGKVQIRGKYEVVQTKKNAQIHITELPYQVNKARLIVKIDELRKEQLKEDIREVRDESARGEILIVIDLKKDANPDFVIKRLLKHTDLQSSFSMNMVAIKDGRPMLFTLKDAIDTFLAHVADVITRRTERELRELLKRHNIVQGFLMIKDHLELVINTIKNSEKDEDIISDLMSIEHFTLNEEQAKEISNMRLRRLTKESFAKYTQENADLEAGIARCRDILTDTNVLLSLMYQELESTSELFKDERRTSIQIEDNQIADRELIKEEDLIVTISQNGMIKSVPADAYEAKGRGTKGVKSSVKEDDAIAHMFSVNSRDDLLFFTNTGRCHLLEVYKLPVMNKNQNGKYPSNYLSLDGEEYIVSVIAKEYENNEQDILMATRLGTIKRLALSSLSTRMRQTKVITFKEGDELVAVQLMAPGQDVVLLTAKGQGLRINPDAESNGVRPMGRTAAGVRGIRLKEDDFVIAMTVVDDKKDLMLVTDNGFGKRVSFENVPVKGRAGQGVIMIGLSEKTGLLSCVTIIDDEHDLMIATMNGIMSRIHASTIRAMGRSAAGVKVINLQQGDSVISISEQEREQEEVEAGE